MSRAQMMVCMVAMVLAPLRARAGEVSAADKAFLEKHVTEIVQTSFTALDEPAILKVFSTKFFRVKIIIKEQNGEQTQEVMVARVGEKLGNVSSPGTDGELPELLKMLNPAFVLKEDADAKAVQAALDSLYPPFMEDEKKVIAFSHAGNAWTFVRGTFFESKKGFVMTTDAAGKITKVEYQLKLK